MKKWYLAVAAGAAAGAAAFVLSRKGDKSAKPAKAPAKKEAKPSKSAKPVIKNVQTGSYSFVSGFKDAATIDVTVKYDGERFSYAVISEEFLAYTGDSHVGAIYGEDFSMQFEYASYYHGEDFEALAKHLEEKYAGAVRFTCAGAEAVRYFEGDSLCVCVPAAGDPYTYLLITIIKDKDSKVELAELPELPDVVAILGSIEITSTKN